MSAAILLALVKANFAGSAAILLILLLRRPMRLRFGPLAAYGLWLAAPVVILAGLLPAPTSFEALAPSVTLTASAARTLAPVARTFTALADVLALLWIAGLLVTAVLFAHLQLRFVRSLGSLEPLEGTAGVLRGQHLGSGPFVIGSLRPRIVTPADFEARFNEEARRLILAHEGVHLVRGDAAINGLAAALQVLAWFNPLVHLAARVLRVDQEIACDAAVVARHPQARRLYAETLLGAAQAPLSAPFACHWPATRAHALKERLIMLNVPPASSRRRNLGLALTGLIAIGGAGAVWAASPAHVVGKPDWVERPTGQDVKDLYPEVAFKSGKEGMAVISCRVRADGGLRACKVRKQDPARYGFGEAALKMSPRFRMKRLDGDGHSTAGAAVIIPIRFKLAA